MNCANCNTKNPANSKFCKKCGGTLGPESTRETKLCPNGHVMDASSDICPYCPKPTESTEVIGRESQNTVIAGDPSERVQSPDTPNEIDGDTHPMTSHPSNDTNKTIIIDSNSDALPSDDETVRTIVGWLVTFTHRSEGQDYRLLEGRNIIGASKDCDVVLDDRTVSSTHAVLMCRGGTFVVEDQLSTNGTWVNGNDIGPRKVSELSDNDILKVGDTTFVFKCFERPK